MSDLFPDNIFKIGTDKFFKYNASNLYRLLNSFNDSLVFPKQKTKNENLYCNRNVNDFKKVRSH
ncbi:MAG TPA: hypothetical protein VF487_03875 [Chitinophagaceae bacterium]